MTTDIDIAYGKLSSKLNRYYSPLHRFQYCNKESAKSIF